MRRLILPLILVSLLLASIVVLYDQQRAKEQYHSLLKQRANDVFLFDRLHPNKLSANELRALSIAIYFHDDLGAIKIMDRLGFHSTLVRSTD